MNFSKYLFNCITKLTIKENYPRISKTYVVENIISHSKFKLILVFKGNVVVIVTSYLNQRMNVNYFGNNFTSSIWFHLSIDSSASSSYALEIKKLRRTYTSVCSRRNKSSTFFHDKYFKMMKITLKVIVFRELLLKTKTHKF